MLVFVNYCIEKVDRFHVRSTFTQYGKVCSLLIIHVLTATDLSCFSLRKIYINILNRSTQSVNPIRVLIRIF